MRKTSNASRAGSDGLDKIEERHMNWILYVIGLIAIGWGVSLLLSSQGSIMQGPAAYVASIAIFSGIIIAAFGNMIGLLKSTLSVLKEIAEKRQPPQ